MQSSGSPDVVRLAPRVRWRVVQVLPITVTTLVLAGLLISGDVGHDWVGWLVLVSLLPTQVLRWTAIVGLARQPWAVEIGRAGIAWYGSSSHLPWSDLERVEVHVSRGARRIVLRSVDRVLFVTPVEASFADRSGTSPASRAILLARVCSTPAEIVSAVRRFSDLPVLGWSDHGPDHRRPGRGGAG